MKAISTIYIGPTDSRPSRVTAGAGDGLIIALPWDSALDSRQNHAGAARALCNKMKWEGELIGGGFPSGNMVWVFAESKDRA